LVFGSSDLDSEQKRDVTYSRRDIDIPDRVYALFKRFLRQTARATRECRD
jgi:hypothetical protein